MSSILIRILLYLNSLKFRPSAKFAHRGLSPLNHHFRRCRFEQFRYLVDGNEAGKNECDDGMRTDTDECNEKNGVQLGPVIHQHVSDEVDHRSGHQDEQHEHRDHFEQVISQGV